ncbi:Rid family hydrolase [Rhizobium mesoamericanum]|uniref:Putative ribonuclease-L-PSP family protein n=1 Tax=Rhizobium mesoamericanum STM3625 TaxID=1211777 RepID=K0PZ04_9HYPH|nr:Rid family hydrolase [Rhizobium mesoamericanum]CCM77035.1 putative ribonuclease-L-PSP family protein [Rhizobium mesoamericanum STM3625]
MAIKHSPFDEASPLQTVRIIGQIASSTLGSSIGTQAAEILDRIDALLKEAGTDKSELIQANFWLRDLTSFDEMNVVWERWITAGTTPRRTTFEDHNLPPLCDLRVDAIAWSMTKNSGPSQGV